MRTARLVGLSQDGQTLTVVTDTGEELAIAADDRLRAALRGDRPRLGQLEIEMDSALRPRDIQSRIRSGESLDDVARAAGIPLDRVERFAAPVLAEREHVARLAVASSVRRRGETSGHRNLRVALTERLASRGVDVDDVDWDSYRMEDGRWAVAGTYRSGDSDREALFYYDLRGRFSVAANEEARWVLGEHVAPKVATGRRRDAAEPDTEPTVDLSDELALVRAVQEPVRAAADLLQGIDTENDYDDAEVSELFNDDDLPGAVRLAAVPTADGPDRDEPALDEPEELELPLDGGEAPDGPVADESAELTASDPASEDESEEDDASELHDLEHGDATLTPAHPGYETSHETWDEEVEESREEEAAAGHSPLDTLYGMLGGDGYAEDSPRVYSGLSDASAVPETDNAGWEPAIMVDYPVEPSASDDETEPATETLVPNDPSDLLSNADRRHAEADSEDEAAEPTFNATPDAEPAETPSEPETASQVEAPAAPPTAEAPEAADDEAQPALVPEPVNASEGEPGDVAAPTKKSTKRKRASVPSWDEIMFGGPKRS